VPAHFKNPKNSFERVALMKDEPHCCAVVENKMFRILHEDGLTNVRTIVNYKYDKKAARDTYPGKWYRGMRQRGHRIAKRYVRVTMPILCKLHAFAAKHKFMPPGRAGRRILGVHIRGTDKVWGGEVIGPDSYHILIRKYLAKYPEADTAVFLASDQPAFIETMKANPDYGHRIITYDSLRSEKNILWEELGGEESYRKGEDVLIVAMLLSMCDYILKCSSAVSEAAIYFNPALSSKALDLQYECGHDSWLADEDGCLSSLPFWGGATPKPKLKLRVNRRAINRRAKLHRRKLIAGGADADAGNAGNAVAGADSDVCNPMATSAERRIDLLSTPTYLKGWYINCHRGSPCNAMRAEKWPTYGKSMRLTLMKREIVDSMPDVGHAFMGLQSLVSGQYALVTKPGSYLEHSPFAVMHEGF
jgi:hypothetical protein